MIILRPKKVIFERFWPFSKFHLPACSTLVVMEYGFYLPKNITKCKNYKSGLQSGLAIYEAFDKVFVSYFGSRR